MNAETIVKILKALTPLLGVLGYELDEELIKVIAITVAGAYTIFTLIEAKLKHRKEPSNGGYVGGNNSASGGESAATPVSDNSVCRENGNGVPEVQKPKE